MKKKWRLVIDYRKLNDVTIGDVYPLPNINDILDQLGHSRYFSKLDLFAGYHQIAMNENDQAKTAFSAPYGHFEYTRMPFGLKTAPATFQRMMNVILTGIQGIKCFVYQDDIIIYGKSIQDHNLKLTSVLEIIRKANLKLQPAKCEFLRREINYLGHVITENGIKPDPQKVQCVVNYPTAKSINNIQSFLGLANYYRKFIKNFSDISKPLNKLLKKGVKFNWDENCQNAFLILKDKITSSPILQYPDFTKPFIITTDASNYAIGAILSQGEIGSDLPISFASRSLNSAETNYDQKKNV